MRALFRAGIRVGSPAIREPRALAFRDDAFPEHHGLVVLLGDFGDQPREMDGAFIGRENAAAVGNRPVAGQEV
jgi:hypothetical protein